VHFCAALGGGAENSHGAYFHHFARVRVLLLFNDSINHNAVVKTQGVRKAVAVHLEFKPLRESVYARDAHAVQAAGDLIAVIVEFAAGVKFR
jgi:hypothetical protein